MARKDRTGNRKIRKQTKPERIPEMGYYLVITNTDATERCFFEGLRDSLPNDIKRKLVIKVSKAGTQDMIQTCQTLTAHDPQFRIPWIVFDYDEDPNFDEIIRKAENADIHVGWSNPCFEIWMYAYFGEMPAKHDSRTCCKCFEDIFKKRTGQKYSKADNHLYCRLIENGNEEKALTIARQRYDQFVKDGNKRPSEMCPCTTVHKLVGEIRSKTKET